MHGVRLLNQPEELKAKSAREGLFLYSALALNT